MFKVGDKVKIKSDTEAYKGWCNGEVGVVTWVGYPLTMVNSFPYDVDEHTSNEDTGEFHLCFDVSELELVE